MRPRKRPPLDPCPVETVLAMVAGKWKARILYLLSIDALSFAEIRRAVPGVTQQVLSAQLKSLEEDGLVCRTRVESGRAHWSRYALAPLGESLMPVLRHVADWGEARLAAEGLSWQAPIVVKRRA